MDHVEVLFKEYDTLRDEIISRTNNAHQLATVFAVLWVGVFSWLVSRIGITPRGIAVLVGVTVAFGAVLAGVNRWVIQLDINNAAARIRELEAEINQLCGAELLKWETHWGGAVTGPLRKRHPHSS
ncbi:MAG: hypothetical protein ACLQVN_27155 [Bryobacteraceae bacterium]